MTNRLRQSCSLYLLQHADNPVDWFEWSDEAFEQARYRDVPVFLSIGYSACHWCHVMAHESFEQESTASYLNRHFVSIKVDREVRPDLDAQYMRAVQMLTGSGGWPMSVWLLPDRRPFYGGTYFPDSPRGGLPSFLQVLEHLSSLWATKRDVINKQAAQLTEAIVASTTLDTAMIDLSIKDDVSESVHARYEAVRNETVRLLAERFDRTHGGLGTAPKFPPSAALGFWREQHDKESQFRMRQTLESMACGGICDQVGGGFHRYTVDANWLTPHFEKMLYDNALLADIYSRFPSDEIEFAQVAARACDYVLARLSGENGALYASQDADSEGGEGAYYSWSEAELCELLDDEEMASARSLFRLGADGTFEGAYLLRREISSLICADKRKQFEALCRRLATRREKRPAPGIDRKVIAGWAGLMVSGIVRCYQATHEGRYREGALRAGHFLWANLCSADGAIKRIWYEGQVAENGGLLDYTAVASAFLDLYAIDFNWHWVKRAQGLVDYIEKHFVDDASGAYYATDGAQLDLLVRCVEFLDDQVPCGNAIAMSLLDRLFRLTGESKYRQRNDLIAKAAIGTVEDYPAATCFLQAAVMKQSKPAYDITISGSLHDERVQAVLSLIEGCLLANVNVTVAVGDAAHYPQIERFRGMEALSGGFAVYVCQSGVCKKPLTSVDAFAKVCRQISSGHKIQI